MWFSRHDANDECMKSPFQTGDDSRAVMATSGPVARPKITFTPGLKWSRWLSLCLIYKAYRLEQSIND